MLQILSALTGDRAAAKACNVIDTGNRNDAYTIVYDRMLAKTGGTAKITREDCKDAVMTSLYGSKAVPKEVFGEGSLLAVFFETMGESAPAVWELNEAFLSIWNPEAYEYNWTLPDNFHVKTKVIQSVTETVHFLDQNFDTYRKINAPTEEGRSLGANCTHSVDGLIVREITRRCNYDQSRVTAIMQMITTYCDLPMSPKDDEMVNILWNLYKESGYLSARILDHLGSTNYDPTMKDDIVELIDSLPSKPFEVVSIHDCFRVLPNYANDLRMQYNRQLYLIAKSEMLSFLLSQIIGRTINVGKLDSDLYMGILDTNYSLS